MIIIQVFCRIISNYLKEKFNLKPLAFLVKQIGSEMNFDISECILASPKPKFRNTNMACDLPTTLLFHGVKLLLSSTFSNVFPLIHYPHSGIYCSIILHLYTQMWFSGVFYRNRLNFKHHKCLCISLSTGDWRRSLCLPAVMLPSNHKHCKPQLLSYLP